MKKALIVLATLITVPAAVALAGMGPGPGNPGPGPGGPNVERMARVLDLSAEQQEKLKGVFTEQREKRLAMRQAMQQEMQTRVQAILTPEQFAKWSDLRQMGRPGGKGYRRGDCGGAGPRW